MCRKFILLISCMLIFGLICPVAAQQEVDMVVGLATPVIDGQVDDVWADAAEASFVPLEDPADGSGIWKVLYDEENLYVMVDVTDDSLHNDSSDSWLDDSVEIYFDGGNTKLTTPLSGDDHQYTFGWTTDEIQGNNASGYTEGIEHAQADTETGWRIEVKMPWMSIWGVVPQVGDLIGIDVYYNDDDDGGDSREGKMLSISAVEGWNDASQWGTAAIGEFNAKASNPNPADGAIDADIVTLEWTAGAGVSQNVYLNGEFLVETTPDISFAAVVLDPGTTYTWRVDGVLEDGTVVEGDVWSFTTLPLEAHFPSPADGAEDVAVPVTLSWTTGKNTVLNDLYIGTDAALVEARDASTFIGKVMQASYDAGDLGRFTTVYWAVDEFTPMGTNPGPVWSFSTEGFVPILEGEQTLDYDHSAEPYVTELVLDTPADITAGGKVTNLTLKFQGAGPPPPAEGGLVVDEATGTYELTGSGADVWGSRDEFHYAYMQLTGDGEISARVVSNGTGSNGWAKGGVMIRESTAENSKHMIMALTGGEGQGIAFQGRFADTGADSSSMHDEVTAGPPHWVKLVREGNTVAGYHSADGVTWELFPDSAPDNAGGAISNPQTIELPDTVLIGLFVTSHQSGEARTYTFDNADIQGDVDGVIVNQDIGIVAGGNSAEPMYIALEDAAGAIATIDHPNPEATQIADQTDWTIPINAFAGVDLAAASKLYIGVGDGEPGGSGSVSISDVKVVSNDDVDIDIIWTSGGHDYDEDGIVDDIGFIEMLLAQGYTIDYRPGIWTELDDVKIAQLNAAKLVIVPRCTNSGDYADAAEIAQWNSIAAPMISSSTHLLRSSRWKWVDSTSILSLTPEMVLADGTVVQAIDANIGPSSFIDADPGNGTVLATGDGLPWIIVWETGVEFYDGAGEFAGGPRMFFTAGTQEAAGGPDWGELNLTAEGQAIFLDAVASYLSPNLMANGDLEEGVAAPWSTYGDATLEVVQEDPHGGDYCLHVTVNSAGANFWDAGLQHSGKVFEAGKSYSLSVWFKSKSGPFEINMKPERAASPWEAYGEQRIILTEEWTEYTTNTGVIPETVDPASITFHIAFAPGEFYVDDASFKED